MEDNREIDSVYDRVIQLLNEESSTKDSNLKRLYVVDAISKTNSLLDRDPNAEWLFDRSSDIKSEPLHSILKFLDAVGDLKYSTNADLKFSQ